MCRVVAVANQKGGVIKSSVVANLGIGLARTGKKVLLIDLDSQGSLTASLGYQAQDEIEYTISTVFERLIREQEIDLDEGILHHEEGVDLMPGNIVNPFVKTIFLPFLSWIPEGNIPVLSLP